MGTDKASAFRSSLVPALVGGIGLWLVVILGLALASKLSRYSEATPELLQRYPIPWHLGALAASLVTAGALALAQAQLRRQTLGAAVVTGMLMGVVGVVGLLAGSLNAEALELGAIRAAVLLLGVVCSSMMVFAFRGSSGNRVGDFGAF